MVDMDDEGAIMRNTLSLIVFVASLCCATAAQAETIHITSGAVQAGGLLADRWFISDEDELHLEGPGVSIFGSLVDLDALLRLSNPPTTVATGAQFDASAVLRVGSEFGARFDNVSGLLATPSTMTFDASPMRVVCGSSNGITECSGSAPFTFHSDLTLLPFDGLPVVRHLIGSGIAEGRFGSFNDFQFGSVRYDFGVTPTPEPATVSLFGVGAAIAVRRALRRRRARTNQG